MMKRIAGFFILSLIFGLAFGSASPCLAEEPNPEAAEKLMKVQMEALKAGDHKAFIANGNRAFQSMLDPFTFDMLKTRRSAKLANGYRLDYLDSLRRTGMVEYLWKVHLTGDKNHLLGRLSLSHGKVVGFDLD